MMSSVKQANSKLEEVAENVYTRGLARIGTILATLVLIPMLLYFTQRIFNQLDTMQDRLTQVTTNQAVLSTQFQETLSTQVFRDTEQDKFADSLENRVDKIQNRLQNLEIAQGKFGLGNSNK